MEPIAMQSASARNSALGTSLPASTSNQLNGTSVRAALRSPAIVRLLSNAAFCRQMFKLLALPLGLLLPTAVCWAGSPTPSQIQLGAYPSTTISVGTTTELLATVQSGGNPVQFGRVSFCVVAKAAACVGPNLLGQAEVTNSPVAGTAAVFVHLPIGTHQVKAVFAGQQTIASSTSAIQTITVTGRYNTTTTLSSSGSAGNYTLTGKVSASGRIAPTGSLSFLDASDSSFSLGSATLTAAGNPASAIAALPNEIVGRIPTSMVVADFDADGNPDIALINWYDGSVQVLYGDGKGGSSYSYQMPVGTPPYEGAVNLAAGDFNGDGIVDLAVVTGDGYVHILKFAGDRSFSDSTETHVCADPEYIATGDFNNDGTLDVVVSCQEPFGMYYMEGTGYGSLDPPKAIAINRIPAQIAVADFNGDGNLDFAVGSVDSLVTVFLGDGKSNFTLLNTLYAGGDPEGVVVGDFNGDGSPDLAAISDTDNLITVFLNNNNGTGVLSQKATYSTGSNAVTASITVGDFNGDGVTDLAYTTSTANPYSMDPASAVDSIAAVLKGKGDGTFSAGPTAITGRNPFAVVAGDWNGDGFTDLAISDAFDDTIGMWEYLVTTPATAVLSKVSIPGGGNHNIYANYAYTATDHSSKSSDVALAGTQIKTTTTLSVSPGLSVTHGQTVQLTAVVAPGTTSDYTESGSVKFMDGTTVLATVNLSSGQAVYSTNSLAVGTHSLTAVYSGDKNFVTSTSAVSKLAVH